MVKTRVAVLGTLSHLREQPIGYDLADLSRLVADIQPDLLGIECEREDLEGDNLSGAPVEIREALVPIAQRSDVVLVPIGAASADELRAPQAGLRAWLTRALDSALRLLLESAGDLRRINSLAVNRACGLICHLEERTCGKLGRKAWQGTNQRMLESVVAAARRDPEARLLVAVQCRRRHWLEPRLRRIADIEVVDWQNL